MINNKNNRCGYCKNYLGGIDYCKFCHFEYDKYYTREDWDVLDLDEDYEWMHLQILNRFHALDLPCLFVDIWTDMNIMWLVGCNVFTHKIADVLGVHRECVYNDTDKAFVVINLYQEKCIREKEREEYEDC